MTIAAICIAYILIVLSLTRLVHVLRAQEYRMRENEASENLSTPPNMAGNPKTAA